MPIFEYVCQACGTRFETLVSAARVPACPGCHSQELAKQLSVFAVATKSRDAQGPAPCGSCGDPRGAGACNLN